jgi:hypothetical protein
LESIKKDYIYPYSSLRFRLKKKTKYYVLKFVAHIFKSKKDRIGSMIIGLIRKLNPFR